MRPYLEVQKLIWKDKMPSLNDSDAGTLAENFDFSGGGEIDNVILKATMNEILNGESPDIGYLLKGHRATQHIKKKKGNRSSPRIN